MERTLGGKRVRVEFNPDNNDLVYRIKAKSAELIDLIETISKQCNNDADGKETMQEINRLKALAFTAIETGAMWGVKAATA